MCRQIGVVGTASYVGTSQTVPRVLEVSLARLRLARCGLARDLKKLKLLQGNCLDR